MVYRYFDFVSLTTDTMGTGGNETSLHTALYPGKEDIGTDKETECVVSYYLFWVVWIHILTGDNFLLIRMIFLSHQTIWNPRDETMKMSTSFPWLLFITLIPLFLFTT